MSGALRSSSTVSRSPSPISIGSKRALSTAAGSDSETESTHQSYKRRTQQDGQEQEEEGEDSSLGASRLHIGSTPFEDDAQYDQDNDYDNDAEMASSIELQTATEERYPLDPTGTGPDGPAQLEIILNMKNDATSEMQPGEDWYIVSRTWFRRWQTACSGVADSKDDDSDVTLAEVGPIDNTAILVEGQLKQPVEVGVDVELLPRNAWDYLVTW
jgi:ubiquitin carboxyl-terminal hydrolase 4/11/15